MADNVAKQAGSCKPPTKEEREMYARECDSDHVERLAGTILAGYLANPNRNDGRVTDWAVTDALAIRARVKVWVETGE